MQHLKVSPALIVLLALLSLGLLSCGEDVTSGFDETLGGDTPFSGGLSGGNAFTDPSTCIPNCSGKFCGDDGCGQTCGACPSGELCIDFVCSAVGAGCVADCDNKNCGPDGCGNICGTCSGDQSCDAEGLCSNGCETDCDGKICGDDGCGGTCGTCQGEQTCSNGTCVGDGCTADCNGKQCGDDGCEGTCGVCPDGMSCDANAQCAVSGCQPDCFQKQCGNNGCGGTCGACPAGTSCTSEGLCKVGGGCSPNCNGKQCGSDGCGGTCGACPAGTSCNAAGACQSGDGGSGGGGTGSTGDPCAADSQCGGIDICCDLTGLGFGLCTPAFLCDLTQEGGEEGGGNCEPGYITDCIGGCTDETWVGDGICDDTLDCATFNSDGGDCSIGGGAEGGGGCGFDEVIDCDGGCTYSTWLGDGVCDLSLDCAEHNFDNGDCSDNGAGGGVGGGNSGCVAACDGLSDDGCWCDSTCVNAGDCCPDACSLCGYCF